MLQPWHLVLVLLVHCGALEGYAIASCDDQARCLSLTVEPLARPLTGCGDCQFRACLTLTIGHGCPKYEAGQVNTVRRTCLKSDGICTPNNEGFKGVSHAVAEVGAKDGAQSPHVQCQVGSAGTILNFLMDDGGRCSKPGTYLLGTHSAQCQTRSATFLSSCSGDNAAAECVWAVALPPCHHGQHQAEVNVTDSPEDLKEFADEDDDDTEAVEWHTPQNLSHHAEAEPSTAAHEAEHHGHRRHGANLTSEDLKEFIDEGEDYEGLHNPHVLPRDPTEDLSDFLDRDGHLGHYREIDDDEDEDDLQAGTCGNWHQRFQDYTIITSGEVPGCGLGTIWSLVQQYDCRYDATCNSVKCETPMPLALIERIQTMNCRDSPPVEEGAPTVAAAHQRP